jgi:predicted lipoprotein with Yx(FWY)xxD motif
MSRATSVLSQPQARAIVLATLAIALLASGGTSLAGQLRTANSSKRVVAKAQNEALGETVLTTTKGRTLYSLSVEKHGKFICKGSCLSAWHPLVVPAGTKPTGPVKLGTIVRPDNGVTQVTYRGRPLYRFGGDSKAGEANGEGIKDVGTWHAATASRVTAQPTPQPQPAPENPYGY